MRLLTAALLMLALLCMLPAPALAQESTDEAEYSFSLSTIEGARQISFEDLADGERPFAITWWLTDCPLCRLSMPYVEGLQRLIEKKKLDIELVTIAIDFHKQDVEDYIKEHSLDVTILHDPRARRTDEAFEVREQGTPLTIVFDKDGNILGKLQGFSSKYDEEVLNLAGIPIPEAKKQASAD